MLTCFVPAGEGYHYEDTVRVHREFEGNKIEELKTVIYEARPYNGHRVVDVPREFFLRMLRGPQGLKWERENPEVIEWIGKQNTSYAGVVFPGEHRPPPVVPIVPEPKMVRLTAPEGVTHFSHGGHEFEVAAHGSVQVNDDLAVILQSHGFRVAA